jgi:hypothetical protein
MGFAFAQPILRAIPDDLTPWEKILDFRQDPTHRLAFFSLREWINKATKTKITPAELMDKIEYEMARTQAALKHAKIKYRYHRIETLVTSGVGFLENLVKVKWSDAAKMMFAVGKGQLDALEEEAKIAENELYYLAKAQDFFGKQK